MPLIYTPPGGEDIADAFRRAIHMARDNAQAVTFTFNGEEITVFPHSIPAERVREWRENMELKRPLYERHGGVVLSAAGEGTGSDDPTATLMRRVVDAFSEYERLLIRARTKAALAVLRESGRKTGGQCPNGFVDLGDGNLEPIYPVLNEASPEYLAAKAARAAEGKRLADVAETSVAAAAVNLTVLSVAVDLCATLAECDHVDAHIPWRAYAQMFRAAGYVAGEGVGRADLDRAPVACGRYIVGQAIACMLRGMPPHPMTSTFADRWRTMPKTQE